MEVEWKNGRVNFLGRLWLGRSAESPVNVADLPLGLFLWTSSLERYALMGWRIELARHELRSQRQQPNNCHSVPLDSRTPIDWNPGTIRTHWTNVGRSADIAGTRKDYARHFLRAPSPATPSNLLRSAVDT